MRAGGARGAGGLGSCGRSTNRSTPTIVIYLLIYVNYVLYNAVPSSGGKEKLWGTAKGGGDAGERVGVGKPNADFPAADRRLGDVHSVFVQAGDESILRVVTFQTQLPQARGEPSTIS